MICSIREAPRPPYSTGHEMPTQPALYIVRCHSTRRSNVARSGATLPESYRRPILLCYFQGKTLEEAARLLGCPKATVATTIRRSSRRKASCSGV